MSCCTAAVISNRTPAELIWHEHSKPPIQNDWNICPPGGGLRSGLKRSSVDVSPGVICCVMILAGHKVLLPLVIHESLTPLPFHLVVALAARAARRQRNVLD